MALHVCVSFVINIFWGVEFHRFIGEDGELGPDVYVYFRTPPLRGGVPGLMKQVYCTCMNMLYNLQQC